MRRFAGLGGSGGCLPGTAERINRSGAVLVGPRPIWCVENERYNQRKVLRGSAGGQYRGSCDGRTRTNGTRIFANLSVVAPSN